MNIEKYLVLNKYFLHLLGAKSMKDLQEKLRDVSEDVDHEGRSYFINTIRSLENVVIPENDLLKYDENINEYVRKIRHKRGVIKLKYFQYLAVLFTEIFFDYIKNKKEEFLKDINKFLNQYKRENKINIIEDFAEDDLKKIAFWMATGSGKTLVMHINYFQFLKYKLFKPDNIILITTNEILSKQHAEELEKSGIEHVVYHGNLSNDISSEGKILIIEITKFVEEKKGRGVTLPIETFEGKNLIFVDEGHKGNKSEDQKWAKIRKELGKNGFVFEYSATFGQILSENNKETLKEYAKSIIFDYSYKHFYLDGYGKDFFVLNLKKSKINLKESKYQDLIFVANLLSFYQQLLVYNEHYQLANEYNIEKPLWIFIGAFVVGKRQKDSKEEALSDVIQIVEFINKFLSDEEWVKTKVISILEGKTNLQVDGRDIFYDRFDYIKNKRLSIDELIQDIHEKVFHGRGKLRICEIKNAIGELGLKSGENKYFGVINIGNILEFRKKLEKRNLTVEQDVISTSLFDEIKKNNSSINILIGSRKFIEGWDTWRISSIGLLNIGKGQGPQIIQLFGRGVRLKGKNMSLKRSGDNEFIKYLETVDIYSIKADYLEKFLEIMKKEDIDFEEVKIPVIFQYEDKWKELYILQKRENKIFEEDVLRLGYDETINFDLDLTPKISAFESSQNRTIVQKEIETTLGNETIDNSYINLLNWERILTDIYEFKIVKNYWNLVFTQENLKELFSFLINKIKGILEINNFEDIKKLEEVAVISLKKYIELFYRKYAKKYEMKNLSYQTLEKNPNFVFAGKREYEIKIISNEKDLLNKIRELMNNKNFEKIIKEDGNEILPRVYFDKHLYLPLLLKNEKIEKITPEGLNENEYLFVRGLRNYLEKTPDMTKEFELYLLRNSSSSGIGFQLLWSGFKPDFIMWLKNNKKLVIVFIDPKGLEHSKGLNNEKIRFAVDEEGIKYIERYLGDRNIILESFILSGTPYSELIKGMKDYPSIEEYEKNNVLFLKKDREREDNEWPSKLFSKLLQKLKNLE
jgi:superfamily II DNA or RNA helicase